MKRALALAALLPAAQTLACEPALRGDDVRRLEGEHHVVAWRVPAPLPLSQFFALDFAVCARDGQPVGPPRVDATMPAHGHGMNYRPGITTLAAGRFRAAGLLLHMPGRWVLSFSIGGSRGETLHETVLLE